MLNCTLSATERTLCCLLETYQTPEGVRCAPAVPYPTLPYPPSVPGSQGQPQHGAALLALLLCTCIAPALTQVSILGAPRVGRCAAGVRACAAPHLPSRTTHYANAHPSGLLSPACTRPWSARGRRARAAGAQRWMLGALTAPGGAVGSRRCCRSTCPTARTLFLSGKSSTQRASPCRCEAGGHAPAARGGGRWCAAGISSQALGLVTL